MPTHCVRPRTTYLTREMEAPCYYHHLTRVRLIARGAPKASVKVLAAQHKAHGRVHVDSVEAPQDGQAQQRRVRKAGVDLAPPVAGKRPIWLLQACNVCGAGVSVIVMKGRSGLRLRETETVNAP